MDDVYGYVDMGTRVSQYPIEKYKGVKGRRDRISILSSKPLVTKSHFHEKVGSFYYLDAAVEKGIPVNVRYNFMIAIWDTDSKGAIVSNKFTLAMLAAGYDTYQNLCDKFELNGDLTKFQIQVTCIEAKYQDLNLEIAGPAPYIDNPELFAEIKARYKEVVNYMPLVAANKIDEKTFLEKIGEGSTAGFSDTQVGKKTDVFKVDNALSFSEEEEKGKKAIEEATVIVDKKEEKEKNLENKETPKEKTKEIKGDKFADMSFSFDETK